MIAAVIVSFVGMLLGWGILELMRLVFEERGSSMESDVATMGIIFPMVAWLNGVDFATVVLTGTNNLALFVSCMIAASFIGAEQSCGYVKNIAGQIPNKGYTVLSKFVTTCLIQLIVLVIYTIVSILCAFLFFTRYIDAYSIGKLIGALAVRFLLFCAIDAILVFFCTLTKSHAIAMVVGAIFGIGVTGLVYWAANMLLGMLKITVDIAKFMPDGINGILSIYGLGDTAVKAIIVSVIFIAAAVVGAMLIFKKRDVR
jgi:ABC-2 type transport system permease protein